MTRNLPVILGIIIVVLSAAISVWYFFGRGASEETQETAPEQQAVLSPTEAVQVPEFLLDENKIEREFTFEDGGFVEDNLSIQSDGQVVFFTFYNNSDEPAVLEFSEKPEEAPSLDNYTVGPGTEAFFDFVYPGRYVVVEQNTNSSLVIEIQ